MKSIINYAFIILLGFMAGACGKPASDESTTDAQEESLVNESDLGGVQGEEIEYEADGIKMKGYLTYDTSVKGKRPGILVVHEWWGHNDYTRKRAEMLAEMGYTAIAVDMYGDGKNAEHPEDAGSFAGAVMSNMEGAKARFNAAMDILKNHESVDPGKIGAIGYCFGGGVILNMARMGVDMKGVASFHGSLGTNNPAKPGDIKAAVLVCHGADDNFVTEETLQNFKDEMTNAEVDFTFKSYEGAVHSFTNPDADSFAEKFGLNVKYDEKADTESWEEMRKFFERVFK